MKLNKYYSDVHKEVLLSFVNAFSICTNAAFVHYFWQIRKEECPCAKDWRNSTLTVLFVISMMLTAARVFLPGNRTLDYVSIITQMVTTTIGMSYVYKLYEVDCQSCSKSPVKYLITMIMNVRAFVYLLISAVVVYELVVIMVILATKKTSKKN